MRYNNSNNEGNEREAAVPGTEFDVAEEHLRVKTLRFQGFGDFGTDKVDGFIRAKLTAVVAIRNSSLLSLSLCYGCGGGVSERSYCFDGGVGKIGPEIRSF